MDLGESFGARNFVGCAPPETLVNLFRGASELSQKKYRISLRTKGNSIWYPETRMSEGDKLYKMPKSLYAHYCNIMYPI